MRRIITLWIVAIAACGKPAAQSGAREDSEPAPAHEQPVAAGGADEPHQDQAAPAPTPEPAPADAATPAAPAKANPAEPAKPSSPPPAKPDKAKPADPAPTGGDGKEQLPGQTEKCTADGKCAAGLTCKTYYGIAGARGPKF